MRKARVKDGTGGDPWAMALRILSRRDYSTADLRHRLSECGHDTAAVEQVIARCRELGYLDDDRYARNRARSLLSQGRSFGRRILLDLKQHGISEQIAEQALEETMAEFDAEGLLSELVDRRYPDFSYTAATPNERRRVVHFLQRRGFPLDSIMTILTRKGLD